MEKDRFILKPMDEQSYDVVCEVLGDNLLLSNSKNSICLDVGHHSGLYDLIDRFFVHPERYFPSGNKIPKARWSYETDKKEISFVLDNETDISFMPIDNLFEDCMTLDHWINKGRGRIYNRINIAGLAIEKFLQISRLTELRDHIYVSESLVPEVGGSFLLRVTYFYFKLENNGTTYIVKCFEKDGFVNGNPVCS